MLTLAQAGLLVEALGFILWGFVPVRALIRGPMTRAREALERPETPEEGKFYTDVYNASTGYTIPAHEAWPEVFQPVYRFYQWISFLEVGGLVLILAGLFLQGWPWW